MGKSRSRVARSERTQKCAVQGGKLEAKRCEKEQEDRREKRLLQVRKPFQAHASAAPSYTLTTRIARKLCRVDRIGGQDSAHQIESRRARSGEWRLVSKMKRWGDFAGEAPELAEAAVRSAVCEAFTATGASTSNDTLFELWLERALHASYGRPPSWPPVYSRWSSG